MIEVKRNSPVNGQSESSPKVRINLIERGLVAAGLVGGTFGVGRAIDVFSFGASVTGHLEPMIGTHPNWILAGVFAAGIPVTIWSAIQDVKLLKNENIGISPNGWADVAYYAFRRPSKIRDIVTAIAPRLVTLDYLRIWGALQSQQVLEAVIAAKAASTIIGVGKNIVELAALKTVGAENKKPVREKNKLPVRGIIFRFGRKPGTVFTHLPVQEEVT